ncbi:hypothetical protein FB446DRAFT_793169 [Lentinula raphanica]|nr:hypothetical protein FB446DRAFT_793169 [Lentinula raphanica]
MAYLDLAKSLITDKAQERQENYFRAPKQRLEAFQSLRISRPGAKGNPRRANDLQYVNGEASQDLKISARSYSLYERASDVDPRT